MRTTLFVILFLAVSACESPTSKTAADSNACGNSLFLGSWSRSDGSFTDTLTFAPNCTGTSSICESNFIWPNVTSNAGTVSITLTSISNDSNCLPPGQITCAYTLSENTLDLDCGDGVLTYSKDPQ